MIDFKENLKNKIDRYIKIRGLNYSYFRRTEGVKSIYGIIYGKKKTVLFKTLFNTAKILNIDVRNFLIFNDKTQDFKNSFENFEEFYRYLGQRFKKFRLNKGMMAKDIITEGRYDLIYIFEGAKRYISLEKFYEFIDKLGMTVDEFFSEDNELEVKEHTVIENKIKNEISVEEFNNRVYELEKIKKRPSGMINLLVKPDVLPTLHMFLKICQNLAVFPDDFFDFDKKVFEKDCNFEIEKIIKVIKKQLNENGFKTQRYIRLDSVFLFCDEKGVSIKDFFDKTWVIENLNKNIFYC